MSLHYDCENNCGGTDCTAKVKIQISENSGNTQVSDDNTTTQVQISINSTWVVAIVIGIFGYCFLTYVVEPWAVEVLCRELIKCD